MRFSLTVIAYISISVCKLLLASSVFEEIFEIAYVFGTSNVDIDSFAILPVVFPLAFVDVSFLGSPDSVSFLFALFPLAFEMLSLLPLELPNSMSFSLNIGSYVNACLGLLCSI